MTKTPMTVSGAQKLREELQNLKTVARPRIIQQIAEARAHGDLSENAEYHAAREQQGFIEGRIKDIESKLATAEIIDVSALAGSEKVVFGATVEIAHCETGDTVTYRIVGEDEANIQAGLISVRSPIARALINKVEGDVARVEAPGGRIEYEIVCIRYE